MGKYLNPGNERFREARESDIFVDKSTFIDEMSKRWCTDSRFIEFSMPGGFGKTWLAQMLAAYYSKGCDSHELFDDLLIARRKSYPAHLNSHDVLYMDMQELYEMSDGTADSFIGVITGTIVRELMEAYPDAAGFSRSVVDFLYDWRMASGHGIIFILDNWDCVMHGSMTHEGRIRYWNFLGWLFKDRPYVELAYLTGTFPVNRFGGPNRMAFAMDYDMFRPQPYQKYKGFTCGEVRKLCRKFKMNYRLVWEWYGGYFVGEASMFCPDSVCRCLRSGNYGMHHEPPERVGKLDAYLELGGEDAALLMLALSRGQYAEASALCDIHDFESSMPHVRHKMIAGLMTASGYLTTRYDCGPSTDVLAPNKERCMELKAALFERGLYMPREIKEAAEEARRISRDPDAPRFTDINELKKSLME